jgi:hypothetical protein
VPEKHAAPHLRINLRVPLGELKMHPYDQGLVLGEHRIGGRQELLGCFGLLLDAQHGSRPTAWVIRAFKRLLLIETQVISRARFTARQHAAATGCWRGLTG